MNNRRINFIEHFLKQKVGKKIEIWLLDLVGCFKVEEKQQQMHINELEHSYLTPTSTKISSSSSSSAPDILCSSSWGVQRRFPGPDEIQCGHSFQWILDLPPGISFQLDVPGKPPKGDRENNAANNTADAAQNRLSISRYASPSLENKNQETLKLPGSGQEHTPAQSRWGLVLKIKIAVRLQKCFAHYETSPDFYISVRR